MSYDSFYSVESNNPSMTVKDRVLSLYKFIRDLSVLKQNVILNITEYSWYLPVNKIPDNTEKIKMFYRDRVDEEPDDLSPVLLSVHKPEFERCPVPDPIFIEWLNNGWDNYTNEAKVKDTLKLDKEEDELTLFIGDEDTSRTDHEEILEKFDDNVERSKAYVKWTAARDNWVIRQKKIAETRKLFTKLYQLHIDLERDSETLEMVVANGFIRDVKNESINHPLLTRRVRTNFDPKSNSISIEDTDVTTELYTSLLNNMDDINLDPLRQLITDLGNNDYHPLDRNDTPDYLTTLANQISSESEFSNDSEPSDWKARNRLLIYMNPVFLIRKRVDGSYKAIEKVIENIEKTGDVPSPIKDIVSGGKIEIVDDNNEGIEDQLAAVGGESIDIILSKEANKEQLEIAKRIENYNAVLVQGPPGTGKTHTIANLLGHFLSQGKNILVTSHTKKALSVLKDKVAPDIRNLCVSIIDDSNEDMEKSIDGITDYMSRNDSTSLNSKAMKLKEERIKIITNLAEVRKKIYTILNRECNNIVLNGEDISPIDAAKFVLENEKTLSYIPGKVEPYSTIPLSLEELTILYESNNNISELDEAELACGLPDPDHFLTSSEYELILENLNNSRCDLATILENNNWTVDFEKDYSRISYETKFGRINVYNPSKENLDILNTFIESLGKTEKWMKYAAVDGKKGDSYKQRWMLLIEQIQKCCDFGESVVVEKFGKKIELPSEKQIDEFEDVLKKINSHFERKGSISKLDLLFNSSFEKTLSSFKLNGMPIKNASDCRIILNAIELRRIRKQCAIYWDDLFANHGVRKFFDLDNDEPELVAKKWISPIERYLNWYSVEHGQLLEYLSSAGIQTENVFNDDLLDSDLVATDKILESLSLTIRPLINSCLIMLKVRDIEEIIYKLTSTLSEGKCRDSIVCSDLLKAISSNDPISYDHVLKQLNILYEKYIVLEIRSNLTNKVASVAPQWAEAIKNREGIHGNPVVPENIMDAWKWKQYSEIIASITSEPLNVLQSDSIHLSKKYRKSTEEFAVVNAWYHMLKRIEHDRDIKQALQGWKITVKRIGKGTGKNAPMYKAKARELMAKSQTAVPCWIMPINRALDSLDPRTNRFDIIIVDEASQSDISALAILYMAKKVIIVGDDKQVSPMAIGTETEKINDLINTYLNGVVPNAHLYRPNTSLYDIAQMTYQPLMLVEHFRSVPEIIGFSNSLSYDYKIKPLRDASNSNLLPSVVNYRVDGARGVNSKVNMEEAKRIVALLKACIEQREYKDKTFGVISLLGDEQSKKIQSLILNNIDIVDINQRRIICGNASNFQGDERDVIFLSVVDSNSGTGPLPLQEYGAEDSLRKRYNVATSRARDQLWVINSLDSSNDLKPRDIRKRLIEFAIDPSSVKNTIDRIEKNADSPFEIDVVKALTSRGYNLVQQYKVGSYRIDIVAICESRKIAIECDGDKYHSGESKLREDMERQTILERIGWRFIRIRGSEYYRNPEKTIERVISELAMLGIYPEDQIISNKISQTSDLLERIKIRADEIYRNFDSNGFAQIELGKMMSNWVIPETLHDKTDNIPVRKKIVGDSNLNTKTGLKSLETMDDKNKIEQAKKVEPLQTELPKSEARPDKILDKSSISSKVKNTTNKPTEGSQITLDTPISREKDDDKVISLLKSESIEYVDKRGKGGSLWIIGGKEELSDFVRRCKELGTNFIFKPGGGRASKHRDAWWAE